MANTVKVRSGTAAELVSLGALEAGELGRETDTDKIYVGDGAANHEIQLVEKLKRTVYIKVLAEDVAPTITNGLVHFTVTSELDGMNLIDAQAAIKTDSSSGLPTFDIYNLTDSTDMMTVKITIDTTELNSYTATTASEVNTTYDDVSTGDIIRIDCDVIGTGTLGLDIILVFQLP